MEFADKIFHLPDKHPEPLARGEGELRWTLLVRHPVASDARVAEPPVPRHPYNPEEDDASRTRPQQLRPGSGREGQAVAGRSVCRVGVRSGVGRLVRRSAVYCTPSRRSPPTYRGRLHIVVGQGHRDVHGGAGRAKGGHRGRDDPGRRPRQVARKGVGQVAGTTHLTRPTGAGAVDESLADLRHPFRWHFGPILERCGQALVETMLPFIAPLADRVVFEVVSFEVFRPWILGRYLRPAHPNAARSMW
jgi:hypothetical protein